MKSFDFSPLLIGGYKKFVVGPALWSVPILALVFVNSNAKNAVQAGDVVEAVKKADMALLFVIISNAVVLK